MCYMHYTFTFKTKTPGEVYEQQLEKLQAENDNLTEETQRLYKQVADLQRDLLTSKTNHDSELDQMKTDYEAQIEEMKKSFREKEQEYETQIQEYGDLEGQILDLQSQVGIQDESQLEDKSKIYLEEIEELKARLEEREQEIGVLKTGDCKQMISNSSNHSRLVIK